MDRGMEAQTNDKMEAQKTNDKMKARLVYVGV